MSSGSVAKAYRGDAISIKEHQELTAQQREELVRLADYFDEIQMSRNPAVRKAWNDLVLLLAFGRHQQQDQIQMEMPHPHGSIREMVVTTMDTRHQYNEAMRHIHGLQYQLDSVKRLLQDKGLMPVDRLGDGANCAASG